MITRKRSRAPSQSSQQLSSSLVSGGYLKSKTNNSARPGKVAMLLDSTSEDPAQAKSYLRQINYANTEVFQMQHNTHRLFVWNPDVLKADTIAIQEPWDNHYQDTIHHSA